MRSISSSTSSTQSAAAATATAAAPAAKEKVEFNYKDALNLECRLTEEEVMVRDVFHNYCQVQQEQKYLATKNIWRPGATDAACDARQQERGVPPRHYVGDGRAGCVGANHTGGYGSNI